MDHVLWAIQINVVKIMKDKEKIQKIRKSINNVVSKIENITKIAKY